MIDNPAMHRFELPIGDEVAAAIEDGGMVFTHTEAPFAFSGQGYGSKLARGAFKAARSRGMHVIAKCPFMSAYAPKALEDFTSARLSTSLFMLEFLCSETATIEVTRNSERISFDYAEQEEGTARCKTWLQ